MNQSTIKNGINLKYRKPYVITVGIAGSFIIEQLLAAVVLCKERLFMDAAYYFFHVLNEEAFRIEHQRVILALSQCLLLVGVKLHLSTHALLVIYSVTPVLYSGLLIAITLFYFKSEAGAWLIMLCCACGNYFLYYCPMYEVCYAVITFGFLCLLTERSFYKTNAQLAVYTLVLMVALLGYPLIVMGCLALPVYHYLASGKKISWRLITVYLMAVAVWLAVKYFFISDYEKGKISIAPNEYPGIIRHMLTRHFLKEAVRYLVRFYPEVFFTSLAFILFSLQRKNYMLAVLQFSAVAGFVFFVNIGYRGDALIFSNNFERMYLLLIPAAFAPFLLIAYPALQERFKLLCVGILFAIMVFKSIDIWRHSAFYSRRIQLLSAMQTHLHSNCAKVAIHWESLPHELDQWSTGMEDLIFSSVDGRGCIVSDTSVLHGRVLDNNHFILRLDEIMSRSELNPVYFRLDSSAYCFATSIDSVAGKN